MINAVVGCLIALVLYDGLCWLFSCNTPEDD